MPKKEQQLETKFNDLDRLRDEYADRSRRLSTSDIYSVFNTSYLYAVQQRQRDTLNLLQRHEFNPLDGSVILELGCGCGGVLLEYLTYGADPKNLHGCDLLLDRLYKAQAKLPHLPLSCADGQAIPYPTDTFDFVLQYTVFSSILDNVIKSNLAQEILRVLQPNGTLLWYDFWLNPSNPQTRGIRRKEIRTLFPNCTYDFRRITLAPPLARRLAPISWLLSAFLEKLTIFNTHYLVAIRPNH